MRWTALSVLLIAVFAALALGEKNPRSEAVSTQTQPGLVVHEWGVFRLYQDAKLANADMKKEWQGLPPFVYGQIAGRNLPNHRTQIDEIIVLKPVIYFHSPQAVSIELRVDFPGGMPAVWWPHTVTPSMEDGKVVGGPKKDGPYRSLVWNFSVDKSSTGKNQMSGVDVNHWFTALRKVKAESVYVPLGVPLGRSNSGFTNRIADRVEEKFIYYDGIPASIPGLALDFDKDQITITNKGKCRVFDVTVVDRRMPKQVQVARLAKLEAGTKKKTLEFVKTEAKTWPGDGSKALLAQLKEAGLNEDESKALVEVWKKDFFEGDGLSLFYRLPQAEYDRLLPLTMKPKPEKLVRVGLVHQPYGDPDQAKLVEKLVEDLEDEDFGKREEAQQSLEKLGRSAFGHLKRLHDQSQSQEVKRRLQVILDKYAATP